MEDNHTVLYTKNDKHIVVGSNAFFKCYDDFKPHDSDILVLVDDLYNNLTNLQIRLKGNCQFVWKKLSPEKFIEYHKKHKVGIYLGKFLVPEFVNEIGFTIEHLKQLEFLLELLDEKHLYEKIIYNAYIENNDFCLTDKQRLNAYIKYKKEREPK